MELQLGFLLSNELLLCLSLEEEEIYPNNFLPVQIDVSYNQFLEISYMNNN
jgi:hypothetical protein